MSTADEVRIMAQPLTETSCRFTVDRPIYADSSFYFGNKERAEKSPLAKRLFEIEGVVSVLISHNEVTVNKGGFEEWPVIGKQVGAILREHIQSGQPAVDDDLRSTIPPAEEIRAKVEDILQSEINPAVAAHGGVVNLIDVRDNNLFIQMGGGCQGCGMAAVTLKHGVERAIREAIPEIGDILDTTDHAAGRNPYYAPAGH